MVVIAVIAEVQRQIVQVHGTANCFCEQGTIDLEAVVSMGETARDETFDAHGPRLWISSDENGRPIKTVQKLSIDSVDLTPDDLASIEGQGLTGQGAIGI